MWASMHTNYIQHMNPALNREELLLPVNQRHKSVWSGADHCLHFTSVQRLSFKHHARYSCSQVLFSRVSKLFQKWWVNIVSELLLCFAFLLESQKKLKVLEIVYPQWLISSLQRDLLPFSALSLTTAYPLKPFAIGPCEWHTASNCVLAAQLWPFISNPSKAVLLKCLSQGSMGQTAWLLAMLNQHLTTTWEP